MAAKRINARKFQKFTTKTRLRMERNGDRGLRLVKLCRADQNEDFGFAIRGGFEHHVGFFISEVKENSIADQCGLQVGDEVLRINGLSVDQTVLPDLVRLVRNRDTLVLRIRESLVVPSHSDETPSVEWADLKRFDIPNDLNVISVQDVLRAEDRFNTNLSSQHPSSSTATESSTNSPRSDLDSSIPDQPTEPAPSPPLSNCSNGDSNSSVSPQLSTNHSMSRNEPSTRVRLQETDTLVNFECAFAEAAARPQTQCEWYVRQLPQAKLQEINYTGSHVHELTSAIIAKRKQMDSQSSEDFDRHVISHPKQYYSKVYADPPPSEPKPLKNGFYSVPLKNRSKKQAPPPPPPQRTSSMLSASERLDKALHLTSPGAIPSSTPVNTTTTAVEKRNHNSSPKPILKEPSPAESPRGSLTNGGRASPADLNKEVSSALDKMHENFDPRLQFTQDQLKGRKVHVVNISKSLLTRTIVFRGSGVFLRLNEQNGISKTLQEEVLMIEGRATAGLSPKQTVAILESLSQECVKLIVARKEK